ncbi:MAG: tail fiber protein [Mariprofundus sp.]|nr:tail fiber protein [Mariprofundus sp.]
MSTIQLKRSSVPGFAPATLADGEMAINLVDAILFVGTSAGIKSIELNNSMPAHLADADPHAQYATDAEVMALIAAAAMPVGAAIPFFGGTVHTGYLKANGAAMSRTSYADLFAEIGTSYGAGDGSTTFNLPDSRGEFMRGWDDARGIDSGRSLGTWQADAIKSHTHYWRVASVSAVSGVGYPNIAGGNKGDNTAYLTTSSGGSETRPRNLAVQFLIKY